MLPFARVSIIGLGLIGSSVARAIKANMPEVRVIGYDADSDARERSRDLGFCDDVADTAGTAVIDAGLVILCVPVGAMGAVAETIAADLPADAIVSDVGSCKQSVAEALAAALPQATLIPAHPVAGTEKSGPDAGFATLFTGRWCI
ncbi:MAG: prephenate dehydrogenase/arogenate dehydrogenase family protein, partial [Sphingorhabdus sp.]|uniref:prephenate dehydrogenase/arogenate dehydrogenase family protein n=1 Tax=Sphingorhabdus sp. TaxID=1902408 RepID=UPI003C8522F8